MERKGGERERERERERDRGRGREGKREREKTKKQRKFCVRKHFIVKKRKQNKETKKREFSEIWQ